MNKILLESGRSMNKIRYSGGMCRAWTYWWRCVLGQWLQRPAVKMPDRRILYPSAVHWNFVMMDAVCVCTFQYGSH